LSLINLYIILLIISFVHSDIEISPDFMAFLIDLKLIQT